MKDALLTAAWAFVLVIVLKLIPSVPFFEDMTDINFLDAFVYMGVFYLIWNQNNRKNPQ